ncbi:hypothetical protein BJF85_17395 [Saccharomonospora sp. CUA-673]|uniref:DUF3558 domain-containing protein n=1 Tax=Saccharomonospora sp. CUA-673 TaxID=1904969 RepID=UPI0009610DF4|nr:DUF3558 domain-containing protein [Saccharomonospora sp. CUA-673]OLT46386.1 hypothetical protein BJF85_17395 [Saccharomonospora sp. CUA-673]
MSKRAVAGLVTSAVLVLTGCAEDSDGQAEPASEVAAESSEVTPESSDAGELSELPHSGAPAVPNPLPESVLAGDPCDALTPDQVEMVLGAEVEGRASDLNELGPGCHWGNVEQTSAFQVRFHTVMKQGLSASYANAQQQAAHFEAIDSLADFPAVEFNDGSEDTGCQVVVGLADEYAVSIGAELGYDAQAEGQDPCEATVTVAEMVVENLKNNAGG